MKKLKIIALLICLCAGFTFAEEYHWPRSYFASLGMGAQVSKGDFNERAISGKDTAGVKGYIHPPALEFIATPDLMLGVNLGAFSFAMSFQYWTSEQVIADFPDESYKQDTRIWRFGLEATYNLFYPEFFQIGFGLGYSYNSVKSDDIAIFAPDTYDAEFMGSAVAFIANIHYYITDNISMVPAVKIYEAWFKNVHCSRVETNDLDPYLWQSFVLATVSVQYQF